MAKKTLRAVMRLESESNQRKYFHDTKLEKEDVLTRSFYRSRRGNRSGLADNTSLILQLMGCSARNGGSWRPFSPSPGFNIVKFSPTC